MLKKILIASAVFALFFVVALSTLSRKAPDLLRAALERSLQKDVSVRAIRYRFPSTFDVDRFEVRERAPFAGETCFAAERISFRVSTFSASKKELMIDRIDVEKARVVLRKQSDRLYHALSDVARASGEATISSETTPAAASSETTLPLKIGRFKLTGGHFEYIDYDVQEGGFVIVLEGINAMIRDLALPQAEKNTSYRIDAEMPQGRDQRPAQFSLNGWTHFGSNDTDASLRVENLFLPYFRPYTVQITPATIENGSLDTRAVVRIQNKDLAANVDFVLTGLLFGAYENGDQLFGLNAEEILSFLKDSSGRLKFQVDLRWNITDRSVKAREVLRRSIERSLKSTVLGNVGNILGNTLQRLGDKGLNQSKDEIEGTFKKVKELFR